MNSDRDNLFRNRKSGATSVKLIDADALVDELKWLQSQVSSSSAIEIQEYIDRINRQPTIEAVPINSNPCGFCGKFNFGDAKAEVYPNGANLVFASSWSRFPVDEQFNFCPVCGRPVKKGGAKMDGEPNG